MRAERGIFLLLPLLLAIQLAATGCRRPYIVTADKSLEAGPEAGPDLTAAQKLAVKQEAEGIENFIRRTGHPMQQTPTGLWVEVYERDRKSVV